MSQPDSEKAEGAVRSAKSRYWRGVIWGTLSSWILVFVPYVTVLLVQYFLSKPPEGWPSWMYDYNISLLLLLPLIQGLAGGLVQGRETQSGSYGLSLIGLISVLDVVVATVFMREGVICLIMALPLLLALIAIGYAIGRGLARWRGAKTLSVSLMPLIVIGVIAETAGPVPVTEQVKHPEIFGHITFDEGEMVLTPVGPNRTRLTMTGHYRLHVRPVSYFAWWSEDVTRHIHFRVMGYMKTLAERDYAANKRR